MCGYDRANRFEHKARPSAQQLCRCQRQATPCTFCAVSSPKESKSWGCYKSLFHPQPLISNCRRASPAALRMQMDSTTTSQRQHCKRKWSNIYPLRQRFAITNKDCYWIEIYCVIVANCRNSLQDLNSVKCTQPSSPASPGWSMLANLIGSKCDVYAPLPAHSPRTLDPGPINLRRMQLS